MKERLQFHTGPSSKDPAHVLLQMRNNRRGPTGSVVDDPVLSEKNTS